MNYARRDPSAAKGKFALGKLKLRQLRQLLGGEFYQPVPHTHGNAAVYLSAAALFEQREQPLDRLTLRSDARILLEGNRKRPAGKRRMSLGKHLSRAAAVTPSGFEQRTSRLSEQLFILGKQLHTAARRALKRRIHGF